MPNQESSPTMPNVPNDATPETDLPSWDFSALAGLTVHEPAVEPAMPVRTSAADLADSLVASTVEPTVTPAIIAESTTVKPVRRFRKRGASSTNGSTPSRAGFVRAARTPQPNRPVTLPAGPASASVVPVTVEIPVTTRSREDRAPHDALATFLVRPSEMPSPAPAQESGEPALDLPDVGTNEAPKVPTSPGRFREAQASRAQAQRGQATVPTWTDGTWSSATPDEKRRARRVFHVLVAMLVLVLLAVWWAARPSAQPSMPALVHAQPSATVVVKPSSTPHPAAPSVVPASPRAAPVAMSTPTLPVPAAEPVRTAPAVATAPSGAVPVQAPERQEHASQPARTTVVNPASLVPPMGHRPSPRSRAVPATPPAATGLPAKPFHLDAPIHNGPSVA